MTLPTCWSDDLNTGVERIDDQHKVLVNTLNEARASLPQLPSRRQLEEITSDLLSYALYHFETEEQLMQDLGYGTARADEMARHLKEHRDFSQAVRHFRRRIEEGDQVYRDELVDFLTNWLLHHIRHIDKKLAGFVREQGGQPPAG